MEHEPIKYNDVDFEEGEVRHLLIYTISHVNHAKLLLQ